MAIMGTCVWPCSILKAVLLEEHAQCEKKEARCLIFKGFFTHMLSPCTFFRTTNVLCDENMIGTMGWFACLPHWLVVHCLVGLTVGGRCAAAGYVADAIVSSLWTK